MSANEASDWFKRWEAARSRRDAAATVCVFHVRHGDFDLAQEAAREHEEAQALMDRIASEAEAVTK